MLHHISIRTADIFKAIAFYEQLGFQVSDRFTTGSTLACWLEGLGGRLELIQIPEPTPAADAFGDEHYVGYYHASFDLTELVTDLPSWLDQVCANLTNIGQQARVLLAPTQQMIGDRVFEVMFMADTDGLPIEFIRELPREL